MRARSSPTSCRMRSRLALKVVLFLSICVSSFSMLVVRRWSLVVGPRSLVLGRWSLVPGCWSWVARRKKSLRHFHFGRQQVLRERLALRVEQQGRRAAAAETLVEQKVYRQQIWKLVPLHVALAHLAKVAFHEGGREILEHPA